MTILATKERPIIFGGPMVRAILAGRKTQTRRIVRPQFGQAWGWGIPRRHGFELSRPGRPWRDAFGVDTDIKAVDGRWTYVFCPYGKPGNHLWVRETWASRSDIEPGSERAKHYLHYRASYDGDLGDEWHWYGRWRPSIHMPRWASRLTLEITGIRVERLQEISIEDVLAEGIEEVKDGPHANAYWREETGWQFAALWDSINGKRPDKSWEANPWVWVIEFKPKS